MPNEIENSSPRLADELRHKAARLFTYLKEICQLRFVTVRDCRNYDELLWFDEIPREPECFCITWSGPTETNESWIEVRRSREPAGPAVPTACKACAGPAEGRNSSQAPAIRERIHAPLPADEPPSYDALV